MTVPPDPVFAVVLVSTGTEKILSSILVISKVLALRNVAIVPATPFIRTLFLLTNPCLYAVMTQVSAETAWVTAVIAFTGLGVL